MVYCVGKAKANTDHLAATRFRFLCLLIWRSCRRRRSPRNVFREACDVETACRQLVYRSARKWCASLHILLRQEMASESPVSVFAFFCGIVLSSFKYLSRVKPYFGTEAPNCFIVAVPDDRRMNMCE